MKTCEVFVVNSLLRSTTVRVTLSNLFQAVQEGLGVSVTPLHFYFPVPNIKSLAGKQWSAPRRCGEFDYRLEEQIERLHREILPFADEWTFAEREVDDRHAFHVNNGFFERVDAEVTHSLIRHRRPRRVIEIGSGHSTLVLAAAMRKNAAEGVEGEFTSIEPHPRGFLKDGLAGLTHLIEARVQDVPLETFRQLEAGDVLFIDSSHVVAMDSDVLYEMLRILPMLTPGVLIHFHDIFAPLDYPEKFVKRNLCFWGEQYMLEAFLSFNRAFKVVWAASAMQQWHAEVLREAFPAWEGSFSRMPTALRVFAPTLDGKNVWPCSFWVERTRD
ncbi:MAG TPA: class I SAM-dependent methyltransferase [Terracidiphilus sp.]|nr:class I SAM-dependent methyltransferase [Terracidiphilus sp.]